MLVLGRLFLTWHSLLTLRSRSRGTAGVGRCRVGPAGQVRRCWSRTPPKSAACRMGWKGPPARVRKARPAPDPAGLLPLLGLARWGLAVVLNCRPLPGSRARLGHGIARPPAPCRDGAPCPSAGYRSAARPARGGSAPRSPGRR
jgi:hypothetical protein